MVISENSSARAVPILTGTTRLCQATESPKAMADIQLERYCPCIEGSLELLAGCADTSHIVHAW
jgi:hypothetical protein